MSEETAGADSAPEGPGAGVDPVAIALTLGAAGRAEADAFLKDQRAFIGEQRHHLQAQFAPQLRQLHLGVWEKRLGLLLRIATAFTGLAVAAGLAFLIWNAANSNALVVDSLSVPPDLAQKGMTGQVVAADMVGRIDDMLTRYPNSARAAQSYGNGFSDGIKIEIPETGVSLSELDRFLREQLGHDVHISGAVVHTPAGLKLTVRAGTLGSASVEGPESDLDSLQQHLAEALFGLTQPYRYGVYLQASARFDEGNVVFRRLTSADSVQERAWGYVGLGVIAGMVAPNGDGVRLSRDYNASAMALDPGNGLAINNLAATEFFLGHVERALALHRKSLDVLARGDHGQIRADRVTAYRLQTEARIDYLLGAFGEAAQKLADPDTFGRLAGVGQTADLADYHRLAHDLGAARATMAIPVETSPGRAAQGALANENERMLIALSAQDWAGVLDRRPALQSILAQSPSFHLLLHLSTDPMLALAYAHLRRFAEAEKLVADMPADCYPCLIARAHIAEMRGQRARADWWFERAVQAGPSLPQGFDDWGAALLARGDANAAIEEFKLSSAKGPHFADPLEGWGEALMAENQSHLALAKFAEAEKYAPNWGRLHLKWGEALGYAGKLDEAKKQFALAAGRDLTPGEKAELSRQLPHA